MIFDLNVSLKEILGFLGDKGHGKVAFIVDDNKLVGSVTDGDVRRGVANLTEGISLLDLMNTDVKYIDYRGDIRREFKYLKSRGISHIPVVDESLEILRILDAKSLKTILPITAVIMAGGLGTRLAPLTDITPKPLLKVGDKPIIDYTFDRLVNCGVNSFFIPLKYKAEQVQEHFRKKAQENVSIEFFIETKALGTIGSLAYLNDSQSDYVLLTNADVLTNICYESFYERTINERADIAVSTITYEVDIPYAVVDHHEERIVALTEKPVYKYHCNSGIYLIRKTLLAELTKDCRLDAPDFIKSQISKGRKVIFVNNDRFWLDIGKRKDFDSAQAIVKQLNFD